MTIDTPINIHKMNIYLFRRIRTLSIALALLTLNLSAACSSDTKLITEDYGISHVSIPNPLTVSPGQTLSLTGNGMAVGDRIIFAGEKDDTCTVSNATSSDFSITIPDDMTSGTYALSWLRDGKTLTLGNTTVKVSLSHNIPDKEGMTIKGIVYCGEQGVAGVTVSDGVDVTTTDAHGIYYLPSKKKYGYVFISIPSNYEMSDYSGNNPVFYQRVTTSAPSTVEQKDFSLKAVDNKKHAVLAMADFHLANRNNDLAQFKTMAADINATATQLRSEGYQVYGISLGDESWDLYWYDNKFSLNDVDEQLQQLNIPFFHCMGNHDNDPYYNDDFFAEAAWIKVNVPVYYSMNIGGVHYVVLDDIQYLNDGGKQGTVGKRNYNEKVISEEMDWLKKDLALVSKTTPLVICMHAPLYDTPQVKDNEQQDRYELDNAAELAAAVKDFKDVQILTGHKHLNYNIFNKDNISEHNTGAICATWWWTGKLSGNNICCDGTPGGYGVYTWDNDQLKWYYKSEGYDKDYQFRAYDLNTTYIDPQAYAPAYASDLSAYSHGYTAPRKDNEVLINVWNYDPSWKVEVTENGKALAVSRIEGWDPLHILSYDAPRIKAGGKSKVTFPTEKTAHLFLCKASSATSTLTITVTDHFGNKHTQTMTRPKAFTVDMK